MTKFTPEARALVLGAMRAGLSLTDACTQADLSENTVKGWLKRGRSGSDSDYAAFAAAVDEARESAATAAMDVDEFMEHLNSAVRAGSVQAMKLWWDIERGRGGDEAAVPKRSFIDELARRRESS